MVEIAQQLGHGPTMTLNTYGHVINELADAEKVSAEEEISGSAHRSGPFRAGYSVRSQCAPHWRLIHGLKLTILLDCFVLRSNVIARYNYIAARYNYREWIHERPV